VFSTEQLIQIQQSSLASVICENTDTIKKVQLNVFKQAEADAGYKSCDDIPKIDLRMWTDCCEGEMFLHIICFSSMIRLFPQIYIIVHLLCSEIVVLILGGSRGVQAVLEKYFIFSCRTSHGGYPFRFKFLDPHCTLHWQSQTY